MHPVVIFDGVCVLCSDFVRFVLRHERAPTLRFCAGQTPAGRRMVAAARLPPDTASRTIVLVQPDGSALVKSSAVLAVLGHLRWPLSALGALGWLVPTALRDAAYDAVAARRYAWFGRQELCATAPRPELAGRFLAEDAHGDAPG